MQTGLVILLCVGAAAAETVVATPQNMLDIKTYPACLGDSECKKLNGHACFQYFCYPWSSAEEEALTAENEPKPFKSCRRKKDCGAKFKGGCFRHHNKREISHGICMESIDSCDMHEDCVGKGGKCCNGYCCNEDYFQGIMDIECYKDDGCQDLLMGDHCCVDFSGALELKSTLGNWRKKCCSNQRGPVMELPKNLSAQLVKKLDKQISRMGSLQMVICQTVEDSYVKRLPSCSAYVTTTPATPETTRGVQTSGYDKKAMLNDERGSTSTGVGSQQQRCVGQLAAMALLSFLFSRVFGGAVV